MPIDEGLTRREILAKIEYLNPGSWGLYIARAGIKPIGTRPTKKLPHIHEYIYSPDCISKLLSVIRKGK